MSSLWQKEKESLLETAQAMARHGLVTGTSGNASLRLEPRDGTPLLAITPSHKPYAGMTPEDILVTDFDVEPVEGDLVPSSETLLHVAIYQARSDVQAVLHTHSIFATVMAVAGLELPPIIDELVVAVGGPICVAEYAFPGTEELAQRVREALGRRNAVIIRSHGLVGVGRSLEEALDISLLVERGAQVFVYASLLGKVNLVPREALEAEQAIYEMRFQAEGH